MASRFLDPGPAGPAKEPEKPDSDLTGGLRGFGQGCGPADGRSRIHAGEAGNVPSDLVRGDERARGSGGTIDVVL